MLPSTKLDASAEDDSGLYTPVQTRRDVHLRKPKTIFEKASAFAKSNAECGNGPPSMAHIDLSGQKVQAQQSNRLTRFAEFNHATLSLFEPGPSTPLMAGRGIEQ